MSIKKVTCLIIACVIIAVLLYIAIVHHKPVPHYQTVSVQRKNITLGILATGKLDASQKVDVGAQVSGQLKSLFVDIGDKVKKGQLLGLIDDDLAINQIKETEADLMELQAQKKEAEAQYHLSKITYLRQRALLKSHFISQQEIENSFTDVEVKKTSVAVIQAKIERNKATLNTARTNLNYTKIFAPMDGEVTQITTRQGQTVIAAQQAPNILTVADMRTMLVKAQISEADVIHLVMGQEAQFTISGDSGTHYEGVLKSVLPTPVKINDAIFYTALFQIKNPQGVLRLDMTAMVSIKIKSMSNTLVIPLSCLGDVHSNNVYEVKLLQKGKIITRLVTLGIRNDTDVEIVQGLQAGDTLIIDSTEQGDEG